MTPAQRIEAAGGEVEPARRPGWLRVSVGGGTYFVHEGDEVGLDRLADAAEKPGADGS